ncbi:MAG TPA: DUF4440 domain-containing protein [Flavobacterium sp.]|nr:DUF4440 domain-containing protein [Flavobacterium sp.]
MKTKIICIALTAVSIALFSTTKKVDKHDYEIEIFAAEKAFCDMAKDKGIADAFYFYADENAVIKRQNDTMIKGRENIRKFYDNPQIKRASVAWKPSLVSVSESGDLGYSYGNYIWTSKNEKGEPKTSTGVFHTVWKRQKDGSWKYVWD